MPIPGCATSNSCFIKVKFIISLRLAWDVSSPSRYQPYASAQWLPKPPTAAARSGGRAVRPGPGLSGLVRVVENSQSFRGGANAGTWLKPGAWGKQYKGHSDQKRRGFRPTIVGFAPRTL